MKRHPRSRGATRGHKKIKPFLDKDGHPTKSFVVYRGPSMLNPKVRIRAVLTPVRGAPMAMLRERVAPKRVGLGINVKSGGNSKIGNMYQLWVMVDSMSPWVAQKKLLPKDKWP